MTILQLASLLIVLAGAFGAVNYLFLKLPGAIGILVVALAASIGVMVLDFLLPGIGASALIREIVRDFEFSEALLEGMLGLLLFAGAMHVKLADLRGQWPVVLLMATLGVALSTAVVGVGFSWLTGMPLMVALVFGALISPTDPVAVLGVLRDARLPATLETKIAGESLFNDGVGYVVYLVLVGLAFSQAEGHGGGQGAGEASQLEAAARLFAQEALGGALLGALLGWITFSVMRRIDDYALEVLITLGLAFGGYQLAVALHLSGPIFAVIAGLFIGDVGMKYAMSEETRRHVGAFWMMVDEILNAVLFLMIGVEVFALTFDLETVRAGAFAIGLALAARLIAVAMPILILRPFRRFSRGVIPIMTWGGLKGGISVALALALPEGEWKPLILTSTYIVVVFSIIVQGLTIGRLATRLGREPELV